MTKQPNDQKTKWQQSQIKRKLLLISRIHLLQRTHGTALLSKYLNGLEPIGNCLALFICKWTHHIFYFMEKTNNQTPDSRTFPSERATLCFYISNWNMTGCLVFILKEVIYRFHLFNIWSKFAVITQAENCFGVLSAVALFEINHCCSALTSEHRRACQSKRTADELWLLIWFGRESDVVDTHRVVFS